MVRNNSFSEEMTFDQHLKAKEKQPATRIWRGAEGTEVQEPRYVEEQQGWKALGAGELAEGAVRGLSTEGLVGHGKKLGFNSEGYR